MHYKNVTFNYTRASDAQWSNFRQINWENVTLNPSNNAGHYVTIQGNILRHDATEDDLYDYTFLNCTFNNLSNRRIVNFNNTHNGSMLVGTVKIINPSGDFAGLVAGMPEVHVQRNVGSTNRIFGLSGSTMTTLGGGKFRPPDGRGWKLGDKILHNITNTNNGYICTQAGDSPGNAEFEEI